MRGFSTQTATAARSSGEGCGGGQSWCGFANRPGGNRTPNPLPKGDRFSTGFGGKTRVFSSLSPDFAPEPLPKTSPISNQIATGLVAGRLVAPVLAPNQGEGE